MSDLCVLKQLTRAREASEKVLQERRRNAIVLILRHLCDAGYMEAYERLSVESNISLSKVDVADNVDLLRVVQEFEEAHEAKFGRKPRLVRRIAAADSDQVQHSSSTAVRQVSKRLVGGREAVTGAAEPSTSAPEGPPVTGQLAARQRREKGAASEAERKAEAAGGRRRDSRSSSDAGPGTTSMAAPAGSRPSSKEHDFKVDGQQVKQAVHARPAPDGDSDEEEVLFAERLMKPLPSSLQGELRELGQAISRDIYLESPNVRWEDIAGLDEAKRLLKEAVVMPIRYPALFTGLLAPWKGLLLFGPPGTGKTLLAKAVATECRTTFFNISASSIISKWRGDSEKLVRVLFELARHHAPSTIFLDELDAMAGARGGEGEHEASRRMKTELLIQMDGLAKGGELVFVLGATNLPWELDAAMLRRLEKRILVPLPSLEARHAMLNALLADRCHPECSLSGLAAATEGYSGSDVKLLAKEAAMRPLRRLMSKLDLSTPVVDRHNDGRRPQQQHSQQQQQQQQQQDSPDMPQLDPIMQQDLDAALAATKPTAHLHQAAYQKFDEQFGAAAQAAAI